MGERMKEISARWRALGEPERARFEAAAAADRERYDAAGRRRGSFDDASSTRVEEQLSLH